MITNFYVKDLRISESLQFYNDVISICKDSDADQLQIAGQVNELEKLIRKAEENFKKDQGNNITADLTLLDQRRDRAYTCLKGLVSAYEHHFEVDKSVAAKALLQVFDKYGPSVTRLNFQAETSTLKALGNELKDRTDLAEQLNKLNLDAILNEMVTANDAFSNRYLDRVKEEAARDEVFTGEIIRNAYEQYQILVTHINARAVLTPSDSLSTVTEQINELIEKYRQILKLRASSKEEQV